MILVVDELAMIGYMDRDSAINKKRRANENRTGCPAWSDTTSIRHLDMGKPQELSVAITASGFEFRMAACYRPDKASRCALCVLPVRDRAYVEFPSHSRIC